MLRQSRREDIMESDYGREFVRTGPPTDPVEAMRLEKHRPLQLMRPCACGCTARDGIKGVGYIAGGTGKEYVAVWIEHEEVYKVLQGLFWAHHLSAAI
jgi:hypothetical protein